MSSDPSVPLWETEHRIYILSLAIRAQIELRTINATMLEGLINDLDAQHSESEACISVAARTDDAILKQYLESPGLSKEQAKDLLLPLLERRRAIEAQEAVNEARSRIDRYEAANKGTGEQTHQPALDLDQAAVLGTCSAGHPCPESPLR